jgi:CrcB protein
MRDRPDHPAATAEAGRHGVLAAIAVGGVLGAEARYAVSLAVPHSAHAFPWSTLLINASGCFLIGVLMVLITEVASAPRLLRPFLGVGVLGGFTTFSTYAVDTLRLLTAGRPGVAVAYVAGTLVAAMAAVFLGANATRTAGAWWAVRAADVSR